ncbi:hypothetical protein [Streptosporangium sp. KLBMP 9127]|nr:hypothetical protein [Streptosporangium sp. KLBMP 9127]
MTPDELEQQLRDLLAEEGFAWILRQVDETIAVGKPEDVSVQKRTRASRSRQSGEPQYWTLQFPDEERMSETGFLTKPVVTESSKAHVQTNAYNAVERANLILEAVRSVFVDMSKVHKAQAVLLAQRSDPLVASVEFRPDENARGEQAIVIAREGQPDPILPDGEQIDQLVRALQEGLG